MRDNLFDPEKAEYDPDTAGIPLHERKLVTQPYDLVIKSLLDQIENEVIHLRPNFQRYYVWDEKLASSLIESILLNIPIPPCYFSQNNDFELDVIDGQQRIFSIVRYTKNLFPLKNLEVMTELNGQYFEDLEKKHKLKIETHTLRCIVITNESHPEIQFDVFERLNKNTVTLNAQEIRNCMYRGALIGLLSELALYEPWLNIMGRKTPDKRMRDEELILRFFAFKNVGVAKYKTPLKTWLNEFAGDHQKLNGAQLIDFSHEWKNAIDNSLLLFDAEECFRRRFDNKKTAVNRALMDLVLNLTSSAEDDVLLHNRENIRDVYYDLLTNEEFVDLITRSVDHKSRTIRRFEIWNQKLQEIGVI